MNVKNQVQDIKENIMYNREDVRKIIVAYQKVSERYKTINKEDASPKQLCEDVLTEVNKFLLPQLIRIGKQFCLTVHALVCW